MHTSCDDWELSSFDWNTSKNRQLIDERGLSFDRVVSAIEQGGLLDVVEHPNRRRYPEQLRVTERDFELAHTLAREEGIPYQTLLSSIIHKYLAGRLVERPQRER